MIGRKDDARQKDSLQEIMENLDDVNKELERIIECLTHSSGIKIPPGDPEPPLE